MADGKITPRAQLSKDATPKSCSCPHPFQESRYGKDKRLHNPTLKKHGDSFLWRCTVCGKEKV